MNEQPIDCITAFYPGIVRVFIVNSKGGKSYFMETVCGLKAYRDLMENLENGITPSEELLQDFREYGVEALDAELMEGGSMYLDPEVRKQALQRYLDTWPQNLLY